MYRIAYFSTCLLIAFLFTACGSNGSDGGSSNQKPLPEPMNLVVVVDMSNRMNAPGQKEKDKAIIEGILDEFELHLKKSLFFKSKDVLSLVAAPQPGVNMETNEDLRIAMKREPGQKLIGFKKYKYEKELFFKALDDLYDQPNAQTGADLYTFFCTHLRTVCNEPGISTNKVIVLTDGYLSIDSKYLKNRDKNTYMSGRNLNFLRKAKGNWNEIFDKNKMALLPCSNTDFGDAEVLMLETAPLHQGVSVYEFDFVEHYWQTWFKQMGLPAILEPQNEKLGNINNKIKEFLSE